MRWEQRRRRPTGRGHTHGTASVCRRRRRRCGLGRASRQRPWLWFGSMSCGETRPPGLRSLAGTGRLARDWRSVSESESPTWEEQRWLARAGHGERPGSPGPRRSVASGAGHSWRRRRTGRARPGLTKRDCGISLDVWRARTVFRNRRGKCLAVGPCGRLQEHEGFRCLEKATADGAAEGDTKADITMRGLRAKKRG